MPVQKFRWTLLLIAIALIVAWPLSQTRAFQADKITIGIMTWAGYGVLHVGIEKGFFPALDIKPIVLDDTVARNNAWMSGKLDMVINTLDVIPLENAQGMQGKVFMTTAYSAGADGIIATRAIKKVEDLKGKRVVTTRGQPSHFLLYRVLHDHGMTLNDIVPSYVDDPAQAAQAFISGNADAAVVFEPYMSNGVKAVDGAHILMDTKNDSMDITDSVRVSDDFLKRHSGVVAEFAQDWQKSIEYVNKNPEESAKIMGKAFGVPAEDMLNTLHGIRLATPESNIEFFCTDTPKAAAIYNDAASFWLTEKIIKKAPVAGKDAITDTACTAFKDPHPTAVLNKMR